MRKDRLCLSCMEHKIFSFMYLHGVNINIRTIAIFIMDDILRFLLGQEVEIYSAANKNIYSNAL